MAAGDQRRLQETEMRFLISAWEIKWIAKLRNDVQAFGRNLGMYGSNNKLDEGQ
jgi:hypothetical protein